MKNRNDDCIEKKVLEENGSNEIKHFCNLSIYNLKDNPPGTFYFARVIYLFIALIFFVAMLNMPLMLLNDDFSTDHYFFGVSFLIGFIIIMLYELSLIFKQIKLLFFNHLFQIYFYKLFFKKFFYFTSFLVILAWNVEELASSDPYKNDSNKYFLFFLTVSFICFYIYSKRKDAKKYNFILDLIYKSFKKKCYDKDMVKFMLDGLIGEYKLKYNTYRWVLTSIFIFLGILITAYISFIVETNISSIKENEEIIKYFSNKNFVGGLILFFGFISAVVFGYVFLFINFLLVKRKSMIDVLSDIYIMYSIEKE